MKAMLLDAEWMPREGYRLSEHEKKTKYVNVGSQVFHNPHLTMVDIRMPTPSRGEVLVKVKATGVCGSDIQMAQKDDFGYMRFPSHCKLPVVLGHEWSGCVAEVGKGVESLKVGDAVCVEETSWCGECTPCRAGLVNQCENQEKMGKTYQGAFAEYVICKAKYCWKINSLQGAYTEAQIYEAGAMVEPCSVVYNALFISAEGFQPGANVLVAGAGVQGLLATALVRAAGAAKVIVMANSTAQLDKAKLMGAELVLNSDELETQDIRPADAIMEATRGDGVKMAVETAGASDQNLPIFQEVLAPSGKIAQVAHNRQPVVSLPMGPMHDKMLHLHACLGHSGADIFPSVIRLIAAKRIDMLPLITARYSLEQAIEAIHCAEQSAGKVMVIG